MPALGGEPAVAYNPRDPSNLVFMNLSGIAVSFDHGTHWRYVAPGVADPQVVADPSGRFYTPAPGEASQPNTLGPGVLVQVSEDKGLSWRKAVQVFPRSHDQAYDRLWLAADPTTGTVYATVSRHHAAPGEQATPGDRVAVIPPSSTKPNNEITCQTNVLASALLDCGDRIVSASHDAGRTWTTERPMDSPEFPQTLSGGFNSIPVAAHGVLATFYYSSSAPKGDCPCVVFETSRDDGAHWDRHIIPGARPHVHGGTDSLTSVGPVALLINDGLTQLFGPYPAADPAHPGRYAVLQTDDRHTALLLYETSDYGRSWVGPVGLGRSSDHEKERPWLTFTPNGALAAYWRDDDPSDSTFSTWVAVASDGDIRHFAKPVQIDFHRTPISETSDDNSDAKADDHYVYVTWGDSIHDNQTQGWFGRYRYR